ncbi:hypothetical protein LW858_31195 (plasmid) [Bacillus cereus]|nr:hypothetical protein [Bacillus cereus]UIJ69637.1 hypothetical protein LW858_31195 [Bacillus cereus]
MKLVKFKKDTERWLSSYYILNAINVIGLRDCLPALLKYKYDVSFDFFRK